MPRRTRFGRRQPWETPKGLAAAADDACGTRTRHRAGPSATMPEAPCRHYEHKTHFPAAGKKNKRRTAVPPGRRTHGSLPSRRAVKHKATLFERRAAHHGSIVILPRALGSSPAMARVLRRRSASSRTWRKSDRSIFRAGCDSMTASFALSRSTTGRWSYWA
jgi:hypothetical protein